MNLSVDINIHVHPLTFLVLKGTIAFLSFNICLRGCVLQHCCHVFIKHSKWTWPDPRSTHSGQISSARKQSVWSASVRCLATVHTTRLFTPNGWVWTPTLIWLEDKPDIGLILKVQWTALNLGPEARSDQILSDYLGCSFSFQKHRRWDNSENYFLPLLRI